MRKKMLDIYTTSWQKKQNFNLGDHAASRVPRVADLKTNRANFSQTRHSVVHN